VVGHSSVPSIFATVVVNRTLKTLVRFDFGALFASTNGCSESAGAIGRYQDAHNTEENLAQLSLWLARTAISLEQLPSSEREKSLVCIFLRVSGGDHSGDIALIAAVRTRSVSAFELVKALQLPGEPLSLQQSEVAAAALDTTLALMQALIDQSVRNCVFYCVRVRVMHAWHRYSMNACLR
jgi:hypothetical protein